MGLARFFGRRSVRSGVRERVPESDSGLVLTIPVVGVRIHGWDYTPVSPYVVQWTRTSLSASGLVVEQWKTLRGAIGRFFEIGLPMRYGWQGQITDGTERRILFWVTDEEALEIGPFGVMTGIAASFKMMDELDVANPVDRGIWEAFARRAHQ